MINWREAIGRPLTAAELDDLIDDATADMGDLDAVERLRDEIQQIRRGDEQCCDEACNGGACESCRCCAAGWCVTGADGLPEREEDLASWLDVAAEHNPVVAGWRTDRAKLLRLTAIEERAREVSALGLPNDSPHSRVGDNPGTHVRTARHVLGEEA